MSSYTSATLPPIDDEDVSKAINALLASNWQQVSEDVKKQVQSVLSKGGPQAELLKDAWRAAEAVEKFCDKLEQMRMELDDQSHDGNVRGFSALCPVERLNVSQKLHLGLRSAWGIGDSKLRSLRLPLFGLNVRLQTSRIPSVPANEMYLHTKHSTGSRAT